MASAEGKTCIITGGTGGIGLATAERLATMGARLVLVGRDQTKGEAALCRVRRRASRVVADIHYADLSRLDEVRRLAATLVATLPRIDILINNAGAIFRSRQVTVDQIEHTFALNHMAYFVLTELLRERLVASAPARVVNLTSAMHHGVTLDFDNLQGERHYGSWLAYRRSKLCNILFTRELAKRLRGSGVTANCLHPGFVATGFGDNNGGLFGVGFAIVKRLFAIPPRWGAAPVVSLATSSKFEGLSGAYLHRRRTATPSRPARDDDLAHRLWEESARLAGMVW